MCHLWQVEMMPDCVGPGGGTPDVEVVEVGVVVVAEAVARPWTQYA